MNDTDYTTFYIVRHGETEWNTKHFVQGHMDSPLTPRGLEQGTILGQKLKHIQFDHVYSSDLLRAKKTAELISAEKNLAIKTTEALREQSYGQYEGKPRAELLNAFKDWEALTENEKFTQKVADIESDEATATRLITFLREIAVTYPKKTMLIVSHGKIMKTFLIHLGFTTYKENLFIENSGFIKLRSDGVDFFIDEV
nr:histidine phosphatase family protein [Candidatus Levybacteria bacterium]